MQRRRVLGGAVGGALGLAACSPSGADRATDTWTGGWVGANVKRGHAWRDRLIAAAGASAPSGPSGAASTPANGGGKALGGPPSRVSVAIVGAGVAGLAAARALRLAGIDDFVVFDLEDQAGGNARSLTLAGLNAPLGAHYLPVPAPRNEPLVAWLHELGLARSVGGRIVYDERHLCHSPQERLLVAARATGAPHPSSLHWQDGLLPQASDPATLAQYRRFAADLRQLSRSLPFALPTATAAWLPGHAELDAQSFDAWLAARGYTAPALRWYLDYCCRDDYGAGSAMVSAWAGLHYFASRHGFHAPGEAEEPDPVLTWPEGNAWLTRHLALGLGERLHSGSVVQSVQTGRHELSLNVLQAGREGQAAQRQTWVARQVILALPLFIALRLLDAPPAALQAVAPRLQHAPWLVSNLLLDGPLQQRSGAPPSWDNVLQDSTALGYVNARHQSLRPDAGLAGPQLLTHYWALGGKNLSDLRANRQALLSRDWRHWARAVVADLQPAHPDLPGRLQHVALMRYGHAMPVPTPGLRGDAALAALRPPGPTGAASSSAGRNPDRLHFAHSDLSAYSVFEEAFHWGHLAGQQAAAGLASG